MTSAFHMPRAIAAFRAAGFPVEAYPVDYRTRGPIDATAPFALLPAGLTMTDTAMHEWAGLLAYRLAGETSELFPGPPGQGIIRSGLNRSSTFTNPSSLRSDTWSLRFVLWGRAAMTSMTSADMPSTDMSAADLAAMRAGGGSRGHARHRRMDRNRAHGHVHRGGGAVRVVPRGRDRHRLNRLWFQRRAAGPRQFRSELPAPGDDQNGGRRGDERQRA